MDIKNKIEGTYTPDKDSRKERIVVGLSGGIDSMVTAYLLKIQKYDLFAVTVVTGWDQFTGNKSNNLACYIDETKLENIKEFCNQLKIPHHVIRANNEFQETVIEDWMGAKVTGTTPNSCWMCHGLRMHLLYQAMLDLEAKTLATGHYAKIFHHVVHDTYYVHSSNDEQFDQSALLNRLPVKILSSLMLPLSDLQKKEVLKLSDNFGLEIKAGKLKMHQCLPVNDETIAYLKQRLPKSMSQTGEFYSEDGKEMFGEHEGIISYTYGQQVKFEKHIRKDAPDLLGHYSWRDKRITLYHEDFFLHSRVQLIDCFFSQEVSWAEPVKGFIELTGENFVECWIHPKSQRSAFIEWEGKHKVLAHEIVTVFKQKGKNSKVFLTGKIRFLPQPVEVDLEASRNKEKRHPEIDYGKDF